MVKRHHKKQTKHQQRQQGHKHMSTNSGSVYDTTPRYTGPISERGQGVELVPRPGADPKTQIPELKSYRKPIVFSKEAYDDMCYFIKHCDVEIGWLGTVHDYKDAYYVDKVYIFEQEVAGAETELDGAAIADFVVRYMEEHGQEAGMDLNNRLRLWGHSHVNMGIGPSGTDEATMKTMFRDELPFFIRVIGNKKGEMAADLYRHIPLANSEQPMTINFYDTPWDVSFPVEQPRTELLTEMMTKVKRKTYNNQSRSPNAVTQYPNQQAPTGTGRDTSGNAGDEKKTHRTTIPLGVSPETHRMSSKNTNTMDGAELSVEQLLWWTHTTLIEDFHKRYFEGAPIGISLR